MKTIAVLLILVCLHGCACTGMAPAAAGHTIRGWDEWAVADMVVGTLIEAGQCQKDL